MDISRRFVRKKGLKIQIIDSKECHHTFVLRDVGMTIGIMRGLCNGNMC